MVVTESQVQKEIKRAGVAGIILTVLTVLLSFSPICVITNLITTAAFLAGTRLRTEALGDPVPNFAFVPVVIILNVISVLVLAGLTYGVFKKNQWCAVLLFSYCFIGLILFFLSFGIYALPALPVYLAFMFFFIQGMMGTDAFHRLAAKRKQNGDPNIH
jgi:hypothetical protein